LLFAKAGAPVRDWPSREGLERLLAPVAAREDGQAKKAKRAFLRALFGDHPYARVVAPEDVDKVTRSDVEAWVGRAHNLRNAALVVIGDVVPAEVERAAAVLSSQIKTPTWVAELPAPAAPALRPSTQERLVPVVTPRAGGLVDLRLGCLLPAMTTAERGPYELLGSAIEARLNTALRIDEGDGYGVDVSLERLRGGATYLVATTLVTDQELARTLAVVRGHWRRWARAGFDATEVNVARWRYAGHLSATFADPSALAFRLLGDWNAEPGSIGPASLRSDVAGPLPARLAALFSACRANAVLGLTGNESTIRSALEQSWPDLAGPRRAGP